MKNILIFAGLALCCKQQPDATPPPNPGHPEAAAGSGAASPAAASGARDYINIVGSSTVYPFSTVVAEQFGKTSHFKSPKVESTGSGGGLKLFCEGVGVKYPDIANASRRIKPSEVAQCEKNGVKDIVELEIGFDGIVLANSKKAQRLTLGLRQLWLALAKDIPGAEGQDTKPNSNRSWSDVDPALPKLKIEVLGPPPTSGTRDAFVELAMEAGCNSFEWIKALKASDEKRHQALCHSIREDGAFIEAGENDNLIVQKLEANPSAFGVFGYSFLEQNSEKVQAAQINGVAPSYETISDRSYPISRPLFMYVKKAHVGLVPGIPEYLAEFTSPKAWGPDGYLADKGMIALPDSERTSNQRAAIELTPLRL
jgi:phosphate transport system substrate-binding protein